MEGLGRGGAVGGQGEHLAKGQGLASFNFIEGRQGSAQLQNNSISKLGLSSELTIFFWAMQCREVLKQAHFLKEGRKTHFI